jgi:hypothetical protein
MLSNAVRLFIEPNKVLMNMLSSIDFMNCSHFQSSEVILDSLELLY